MRTQRKAPQLQAAHSSNKTAVPGWPDRPHRGPACLRGGAMPPAQRYVAESTRSRLRPAPSQGSKSPERSTPMIPLTLRAMNRTPRQRGRSSARSSASLLSVLVLVALACFPVLAHAASEIPQYESEIPTTKGHQHPPAQSNNPPGDGESHSDSNGGATVSDGGQAGTPGSGSSSGGSSSGGQAANAGNNPSTASGGGNGQGSPGNGATADGKPGTVSQAKPISSDASSSDDGGSSPLVPILIAIAALAAISIGAVVIKQKRQGPGSPISPEAS
jgi:hypothetical protein